MHINLSTFHSMSTVSNLGVVRLRVPIVCPTSPISQTFNYYGIFTGFMWILIQADNCFVFSFCMHLYFQRGVMATTFASLSQPT